MCILAGEQIIVTWYTQIMSEFINAINGPEVLEISYKAAKDWDSLYEMINLSTSKQGGLTPEQQIKQIEEVRSGKEPLSVLSNDFDLQEIVGQLLGNESEIAA